MARLPMYTLGESQLVTREIFENAQHEIARGICGGTEAIRSSLECR